jgi:hypothetical protein
VPTKNGIRVVGNADPGLRGRLASIVNFLSVYPGLLELGMLPCKTLQLVDGLEVFHRGFSVTFKESFGGRTHSALLGGQQRRKHSTPVLKRLSIKGECGMPDLFLWHKIGIRPCNS